MLKQHIAMDSAERYDEEEFSMALDWSQCPTVESVPGRVSGAWVLRGTRMPVSIIFDNLAAGMTIDEVIEEFEVSREEVTALLDFVAHSLEKTPALA